MNTVQPSAESKCGRSVIGVQLSSKHKDLLSSLGSFGYDLRPLSDPRQPGKEDLPFSALCVSITKQDLARDTRLRELNNRYEGVPVILVCDQSIAPLAIDAVREGLAYWHITPPIGVQDLGLIIAKACVHHELTIENSLLRSRALSSGLSAPLLGSSSAMDELKSQVLAIARLDSTVLLTGESGTGKTTVARAIHQQGSRAAKPFVSINCASIPRELLEAELFGYERGAFTGAVRPRLGSIEAAEGGTLFLDEIGDLPLDLQPKLLSFLQDRTIRRLGSHREIAVDVRVIAATNRDLEDLRKKGLFRDDLYFRINVLRIQVPPLRTRRQDILEIANARIAFLAPRVNTPNLSLSSDATQALQRYDWPGNVRELENILERAAVFCRNGRITEADLQLPEHDTSPEPPLSTQHTEVAIDSLDLEKIERLTLARALDRAKGHKPEAARLLGISLKSIYNKIRKYRLDEDGY